jgi:hypothetical protein
MCRAFTESAVRRIEGLAEKATDEGVRLAANKVLLDRGWGVPTQKHKHSGDEEEGPINVNLVYRVRTKK